MCLPLNALAHSHPPISYLSSSAISYKNKRLARSKKDINLIQPIDPDHLSLTINLSARRALLDLLKKKERLETTKRQLYRIRTDLGQSSCYRLDVLDRMLANAIHLNRKPWETPGYA